MPSRVRRPNRAVLPPDIIGLQSCSLWRDGKDAMGRTRWEASLNSTFVLFATFVVPGSPRPVQEVSSSEHRFRWMVRRKDGLALRIGPNLRSMTSVSTVDVCRCPIKNPANCRAKSGAGTEKRPNGFAPQRDAKCRMKNNLFRVHFIPDHSKARGHVHRKRGET